MSAPTQSHTIFSLDAPIWGTAFRPFFLFGTLYGVAVIGLTLMAYAGMMPSRFGSLPMLLWHGHEMMFGFAGAIVSGFLLTALPGWGRVDEFDRTRVMLLTLTWLCGRVAFWLLPQLPIPVVAAIDSVHLVLYAALVAPRLWQIKNRVFLALLPVLGALIIANLLFYAALTDGDDEAARWALRLSVYSLMFLVSVVAGFLIPVFTSNLLIDRPGGTRIAFVPVIEWMAAASILLFAITGLMDVDGRLAGTVALLAAAIHLARVARWRSVEMRGLPYMLVMHVGYAWLVITLMSRAVTDFGGDLPESLMVHAFTVGCYGLIKLGVMSRVVLYHTGRLVTPGRIMSVAYVLMFVAAMSRAAAPLVAGSALILVSGLLWAGCQLVYIGVFGRLFVAPSLEVSLGPRRSNQGESS
jgi:uncharacterized protein involved in response to NO